MFDFPQGELSQGFWALMPPAELNVFNKLEEKGDQTVGHITDSIFHATSTSANKVYVVDVLDADRIEPDDSGEVVTVVPTGGGEQYEVETDLLRPFLKGEDIERWNADWSGLHLLHPYRVEKSDGEVVSAEFYQPEALRENLPRTWDYFTAHKERLEARERGRKRGSDDWYAYIYDKNLTKFENPKIVQAHVAEMATYVADPTGIWYFTTAYGVLLKPQYRNRTSEVLCQLNSKALDFYFKHIANIKAGGYYEYIAQYVEKVPCSTDGPDGHYRELQANLDQIMSKIDRQGRTDRFPEAYLGGFTGELEHVDYEWQTARRPVNASIQSLAEGGYAVEAGRTDSIRDPRMDSEERARYVHSAVDGRTVKKGEEIAIPIPRRDADVAALLEDLETDRQAVEETDIEALEAEIDQVVYDLFELTEEERQVIEDFLEVF